MLTNNILGGAMLSFLKYVFIYKDTHIDWMPEHNLLY